MLEIMVVFQSNESEESKGTKREVPHSWVDDISSLEP